MDLSSSFLMWMYSQSWSATYGVPAGSWCYFLLYFCMNMEYFLHFLWFIGTVSLLIQSTFNALTAYFYYCFNFTIKVFMSLLVTRTPEVTYSTHTLTYLHYIRYITTSIHRDFCFVFVLYLVGSEKFPKVCSQTWSQFPKQHL